MGLLRMGRLSILLMSSSRSANTLSALKSCPGPSGTEKTTLVLKSEAPPLAAAHGSFKTCSSGLTTTAIFFLEMQR